MCQDDKWCVIMLNVWACDSEITSTSDELFELTKRCGKLFSAYFSFPPSKPCFYDDNIYGHKHSLKSFFWRIFGPLSSWGRSIPALLKFAKFLSLYERERNPKNDTRISYELRRHNMASLWDLHLFHVVNLFSTQRKTFFLKMFIKNMFFFGKSFFWLMWKILNLWVYGTLWCAVSLNYSK